MPRAELSAIHPDGATSVLDEAVTTVSDQLARAAARRTTVEARLLEHGPDEAAGSTP